MSHQDRRGPLPVDYQYPTHGVDCDCPPCRNRVAVKYASDFFADGLSVRFIKGYDINSDQIVVRADVEALRVTSTAYGWGV